MFILKFILFTHNSTSVRPFIVRMSCALILALFSLAILEIIVLVMGVYGIHPNAEAAAWLLQIKAAAGKILNGI